MGTYLTEPDKLEDYNTIEPGSPEDYKREQYQELRDNNPVPVLPFMNYKSAAITQQKPQTGNLHDPDSNIQSMEQIQSIPARVAARDTVNQLQGLAYTPPPKPKYDTKNPEYLKRAAKMSRIGEGLGVLGKAAILAMGGTVPQAKVNTAPREYMNQYMSLMDRQQQMENQYNLTEWQANENFKRQKIAEQMRQQQLDQQGEYNRAKLESDNRNKEFNAQMAQNKMIFDVNKANKELDLKERKTESDIKYQEENAKSNRIRAYNTGKSGAADKKDKPVKILTKYSKEPVILTQEQASQIRHQALQNAEVLKDTHPELFIVTQEMKEELGQEIPTGRNILTVKKDINEEDLIRAMIELEYEQEQTKATQQAGVQNALKSWGVTEPKSNTQVPLRAGATAPAKPVMDEEYYKSKYTRK